MVSAVAQGSYRTFLTVPSCFRKGKVCWSVPHDIVCTVPEVPVWVQEEAEPATPEGDAVQPPAKAASPPTVLETVVALYSFTPMNEEELSFAKGEQLEVVDKPENDPDWWKARNQAGHTGLVPKNYVQVGVLALSEQPRSCARLAALFVFKEAGRRPSYSL